MHLNLILYLKSILLLIGTIIGSVQPFWSEFEWVGIENAKTGVIHSDLKVTRYNRTELSLSGKIFVTEDLNDDYDCEFKIYFSSKGTSKYVLTPYKVPRDACCKLMESYNWKAIESRLAQSSDFPKRKDNENYCLLVKKGTYTIRQFIFDHRTVPKVADTGIYRCGIIIYKKGFEEMSSTATFFIRLY